MAEHMEAAMLEPDAHFQWQSPDEATVIPFSRNRRKALELAAEWDLCIAGDGLHHLQQCGCEADFIPLTQVTLLACACTLAGGARCCCNHQHAGADNPA